MTLELITGAANAGKTGAAYGRLRELLASGVRPLLILPSEPDVERAAEELAGEFPVGLRVMTFEQYVRLAWDQAADGRTIVTRAQRGLLCAGAARVSGASRGLALLTAECAQALSEQTGFAWRRAEARCEGAGEALASGLRGYAQALEESGLVEPAEATHQLAAEGGAGEPLVLHRFTDFTPSQVALIRERARVADVSATITFDPDIPATGAAEALIGRLGPHKLAAVPSAVFDTDVTLEALASALFGAPAALAAGTSVRFSLAEGGEAEAQRLAEEVREAILEGVASAEERIAVVFRDPGRHAGVLRQAFRDAGISADFDVMAPFGSSGFGSAVRHLLGFVGAGARVDLCALLRSPFSGADREAVRELERRWRSGGTTERGELLSGVRRAAPELAKVLRQAVSAAAQPEETGLEQLAEAIDRLFALGYRRSGTGVRPDDQSNARAHRAAMSTLSEAAQLQPARFTLSDIGDVLDEVELAPGRAERAGHVQVTSASRVRGRRFDTVILGGLNADEFPASEAETMLPGSAVDGVLRAFGGSGGSGLGPQYEQYLFYLVATRAKRRLVLSARNADDDGEQTRLSPFFEAAADSFRDPLDDDAAPPHVHRALAQPPASGPESGERENARAAVFSQKRTSPRLSAAARRAAARTPRLTDAALLEGLSGRMVFSASEIEAYLECPYGWFHRYGVRARELEREFGAAEQGTYAHALLAQTYAILREAGIPRVSRDTLPDAADALEQAVARLGEMSGPEGGLAERIARTAARRWAARVLADDADMFDGFSPTYLEWGFGGEDDRVAIGTFHLAGRVDRIDVDELGRAVVIDYKRSSVPTAAHILELGKVQIPLYFKAAEAALGVRPVCGLYRSLSKRENRGLVLDGALPTDSFTRTDVKDAEAFDALVRAGLGLAEEAVDGIRAGRIACEPRSSQACTYCGASSFCGVGG